MTSTTELLQYGNLEYGYEVARGNVPGSSIIAGFGKDTPGAEVTLGDVWGGPTETQPEPSASGEQITVVSTSANDTDGGSGAQSVRVIYLDDGLIQRTTDVTLNGTTGVTTTPENIRWIQCAFITSVGSTGASAVADGDITLESSGGTVYKQIPAGATRCLSAARMVPSGKRMLVTHMQAGASSNAVAEVRPVSDSLDGEAFPGIFLEQLETVLYDSSAGMDGTKSPIVIPEGSIFKAQYNIDKAGVVTFSWRGILEPA